MNPLAIQELGAPNGGNRLGTVGIIWHTTEPSDGTKQLLKDAIGTARWQASTGNTSGGSYNFIVARDGVVLTVQPHQVSWGVATSTTSFQPGRFPFLAENLSPPAVKRPNHYMLNIAVQGRTAWFNANGWPSDTITNCALLTRWLEATYAFDAFFSGHFHWNTTRSDPGPNLIPAILNRYGQVATPPTQVQILHSEVAARDAQIVVLDFDLARANARIEQLTAIRQELEQRLGESVMRESALIADKEALQTRVDTAEPIVQQTREFFAADDSLHALENALREKLR